MQYKSNSKEFIEILRQKTLDRLDVAGGMLEGFISREIKSQGLIDKGGLINSRYYKVYPKDLSVRAGITKFYGAVHELGATILPKKAKALAVPIHPNAKARTLREGQSIRDAFPDLVYIKRKSGHPLLVKPAGRGMQHGRMDVYFVLVPKVTIPKRPFLRPALYNNLKTLGRVFTL